MMKEKKRATALGWLAVLLLTATGCEGMPQPLPIPSPKLMRLGGAPPSLPVSVRVVGLPKAVAGAGAVTITNITRAEQGDVDVQSSQGGSFAASITAVAEDELAIRYEDSDAATVTVPKLPIGNPRAGPAEEAGVPPITWIDATRIRLRGILQPTPAVARTIIAVNVTSGAVVTALTDDGSRFDLEIQAAAGDGLEVYEDLSPLVNGWALTVSAP